MTEATASKPPPLGLTLGADGSATVVLWAPHASAVDIELRDSVRFPLHRNAQHEHFWSTDLPTKTLAHRDQYRFVVKGPSGEELLRRDPYARSTDCESEWCMAQDHTAYKWKTENYSRPEFGDYAIYELHVGSFTPEGTFDAVRENLPHVANLGFTAIQVMPILEHSDLWGYNPRQFLSLHGKYGTPDSLKALVDVAHALGIAVIVDVVLHHGAVDGNALWDFDGWERNNNGGIYHENAPDTEWGRSLAHWKSEVMDMLRASCAMYIEEYKVDGLRFDSATDLPTEACQQLTWACREKYPDVFLTAEVTPENPMAVRELGFHALWIHSGYFDVIHQHRALGRGHHGGGDWADGWDFGKLRTVFTLHFGFEGPTECVKYLTGSHDQIGCKNGGAIYEDYKMIGGQHRYATDQFGGGRCDPHARSAVRAWFTVNICAAGVPMMFMGTEWAQPGWWNVDEHRRLTWELKDDEVGQPMMKFVSDAMALRKRHKVLRLGWANVLHEDRNNGVVAVERTMDGEERVIVVLNAGRNCFQDSQYGVYVGGGGYDLHEIFTSQKPEYDGWQGQHSNQGRAIPVYDGKIYINLPTQSAMVFSAATA